MLFDEVQERTDAIGENFSTNGDESLFMSRLDDWDDPLSTHVGLVIILGFSLLSLIAIAMPFVAAIILFILGLLGFFVWRETNHSDASEGEEEETHDRNPLPVLKERYARGELSEEEFEHRVTMLLDVDEIARSNREDEFVAEQE